MKIEIEIPDLEEIYCSYYDGETITGRDIKKMIADIAIEKFTDKMYDDYIHVRTYGSIRYDVNAILQSHSKDIIDKVTATIKAGGLKEILDIRDEST